MAKIDKIKEEISFLKMIFGILVAIDISIIGWLFSHQSHNTANTILAIVAIFSATIGIVAVNKKILQKIDQLEEL